MTKQAEHDTVFDFSVGWYCLQYGSVLVLSCAGGFTLLTGMPDGNVVYSLQNVVALIFIALIAVACALLLLPVLWGKMRGLPIMIAREDAPVVRYGVFYRRVVTIPWQKIDEIALVSSGLYSGWYFCLRIDSSLMRSLFPKKEGLDADVLRVDTWIVQGRPRVVLHTLRQYWLNDATPYARIHHHLFAAQRDQLFDFEKWTVRMIAAVLVIGMIYAVLKNLNIIPQ